jgi:tetratricopeptide (TPR) repeat protein
MSRSILQLLTVLAAVLFSFSADALLLEQLSVVPSQAEQPRTAGERKFAEGRELLGQNKLREAAAAFEESARADPRSYLPLLGLAEVASRERHSEDAEKYLRRAEGIAPQSAEVQTAIGQFYYGRKDYAKSEAALKKATGMEPKLIWPWLALGELYNGSQRWPAAVDAFRNVLKIDPNHAGGHFGLGRALSHSGKLDEALAEFDTAARLAPNNPLPLLAKAQLLFAQKQYDKSLAAYDQALDMHVDDVAVRMGRGEVLMAQGQGDRGGRGVQAGGKGGSESLAAAS